MGSQGPQLHTILFVCIVTRVPDTYQRRPGNGENHLHAITADWSVPAEAAQEKATKASTTQSLGSYDSRRQPTNVCPYFLPESSWPISPPHEHRTPNPLHAAGRRTGSRRTEEPPQTRWHHHFIYCLINTPSGDLFSQQPVVWFFSPPQYACICMYSAQRKWVHPLWKVKF